MHPLVRRLMAQVVELTRYRRANPPPPPPPPGAGGAATIPPSPVPRGRTTVFAIVVALFVAGAILLMVPLAIVMNLLAIIAAALVAIYLVFYGLALNQILFTTMREGTGRFVMDGGPDGAFNHLLWAWKGHYSNDPRMPWFDPHAPAWEILDLKLTTNLWLHQHPKVMPSNYPPGSVWRLFEKVGLYWFGFPPRAIHRYMFEWTEEKIDAEGKHMPWHRKEPTDFIFLMDNVYWMKLEGAETNGNIPLDVDYLLTVGVNNPIKARFGQTNWLTSLGADSNNAAKRWIGDNTFQAIAKEQGTTGTTSGFVVEIAELNDNLPTHHATIGATELIGATVKGASLQKIDPADSANREEILKATTAPVIAELNAQATRTTADAEAYRIRTVYGESEGNTDRMRQKQWEAMRDAKGTVFWIPEVIANFAQRFGAPQPQGPQQPPQNPQPGAPPAGP